MFFRKYEKDGKYEVVTISEEQNEKMKEQKRDEILAVLSEKDIDTMEYLKLSNEIDMQTQTARDVNDLETRIRDVLWWTL